MGNVVDLDRAQACAAERFGTLLDYGLQPSAHFADRAQHVASDRDDVAAEIGDHSAAAGWIESKMPGSCGIRHVVLRVDAAERHDVSDFAARDDLACQSDERGLQIVEPDLSYNASFFGGIQHLF